MNKDEYYKKVNEDSFLIGTNVLESFTKNEHNIYMSLTGGALRDLILDKETEIRDLDFILSFEDLCKKRLDKKDKLYMEDLVPIYNDNLDRIKNEFIKKGYDVQYYKNFTKEMCDLSEEGEGIYDKLENLMGVLKIKGNSLNYDVDILLVLDINNYVNAFFDFNICKVQAEVINNNKMPETSELLIEKGLEMATIRNYAFLEDVKNKTITYDERNKKEPDIINSFQKHLPKITKKYPDYQIKLDFKKNKEYPISERDEKSKEEKRLRDLSESLFNMFMINLELEKVVPNSPKKIRKY